LYKNTGCNILKGGPIEEAQLLLDEHIVKTQNMLASPFAAPFEEHLTRWLNSVRINVNINLKYNDIDMH
jgi:dynein heavy chain